MLIDNNNEQIPFVDKRVVEYLKRHYTPDMLIRLEYSHKGKVKADRHLGRIEGVLAVIDFLEATVREQEGD